MASRTDPLQAADSDAAASTDAASSTDAAADADAPGARRARGRALRIPAWADLGPVLAITATVLLANLAYLSGLFDPDPLHFRSGLTSAMTPGLLGGRPTIDPSNGFTSQAIGHLAALDLLHLHLPWWNPYEGTGMPLLGETQSAALFPLTLLTAVSGGQLYEHVLLELIAGICTYLLLRRLGVGRAAATAGAIAYALNGKFAWFADATVNPLPFLPMLLLGIERAYAAARDGQPGGWRVIALAGALTVYAGFPEVAYVDGLMALCWLGWRCGCLERGRLRSFGLKAMLGAATGTLLSAPMLLAMANNFSRADLLVHAGSQLGSRHLPPSALPQMLMPYIYGQVNTQPRAAVWIMVGGYLSTSLVLLAIVSVFSRAQRGLKAVLLGWTVLVLGRMYGVPVIDQLLGVLPDMSRIQFFRYATAALALTVIVLAALGLDELQRSRGRRLLWGAPAIAALVIAGAVGARPVVDSLGTASHPESYFAASVAWGGLVALAVGLAALLRSPRLRGGLLSLLVALDSLALFVVPELAAPRSAAIDLAPVSYLRRHLGEGRFFTLGPIRPDYGSYFGLASLGLDDFPPRLYADYVRTRIDPAFPFIGFRASGQPSPAWELVHHLPGYRSAAVRYVLAPASQPLPESATGLRLVLRTHTTRIYRLAGAAGYFSAPGCRLSSTSRESAQVACARRTVLVRRETWFPGWSARVDGRPATLVRAGGPFQGVVLGPGTHRVTFAFIPPGMGWALLALVVGCALLPAPGARRLAGSLSRSRGAGPQASETPRTAAGRAPASPPNRPG